MLQIRDIHKEYRTGSLVQKALDGVSLNFRDSEFVAILGPSGSGKTTLLNVVGGLDRYDSGDLIINGVSTKKYKDRDWDSYRNHTIGFVFQSYNLIPHQTVLQNVELALTISGISGEERTKRATEALTKVGLGDQLHKLPNQMSGGQMQRVAIARALVNNPDILLADEPTGALDSATSVAVMDLLKEVASDRLVIMVTHNPELAHEYANRIVELKDGKIVSDTNPYVLAPGAAPMGVHKNLGRAAMNFATALALSFNNLKTKKARTILVAFAGSIGIIGIAMILSLSNGVNNYIDGIENDTIRQYPLTVDSTSFDMSSMFASAGLSSGDSNKSSGGSKAEVREMQTVTNMFSMMNSNDLKSLKKYIDSGKSGIEKYSRAIEYSYSISPQIYRKSGTEYRQVNPDQTRQKMGVSFNQGGGYGSMISTDVFHELPKDDSLYRDEYDVKAGHWPKKYNECVVVLSENGSVSDLALYAMGVKDIDKLDKMLSDFAKGKNVTNEDNSSETFTYNDLMGIKFKMINSSQYYSYDSGNGVWVDHSDDSSYMENIIDKGETLKIVGVVQPKKGSTFSTLTGDIYYPETLTRHIIRDAADSGVVKAQTKNKKKNVLTGKPFGEKSDGVDFSSMFSVDPSAMQKAFQFDASGIKNAMKAPSPKMDFSGLINPNDVAKLVPSVSSKDLMKIIESAGTSMAQVNMQDLFDKLMKGFLAYSAKNGTDYTKLQTAFSDYITSKEARQIISDDLKKIVEDHIKDKADSTTLQDFLKDTLSGFPSYYKENYNEDPDRLEEAINAFIQSDEVNQKIAAKESDLQKELGNIDITDAEASKIAADLLKGFADYSDKNNLPSLTNLSADFSKYLSTKQAQAIIAEAIASGVDTEALEKQLSSSVSAYVSKASAGLAEKLMQAMMTSYMKNMGSSMGNLDFSKLLKIDTSAFADMLSMNLDEDDLNALMMSMMNNSDTGTYSGNLRSFGYANLSEPTQIAIYAKNFESKEKVKDRLDAYNDRMRDAGEDKKVVSYNDLAGALMSSVTDIINAISYVLIAFVSISLVVSSIMIGVITYISVLERRKEIGILRAIGASKNNIAQVFNAETFIIGALAGLFGIGITELLLIPTNMIIRHFTDAGIHAALPPLAAVLLVLLSIGLTLLGGIIPSRKAAKSDPVTALRVD